MNRIKEKILHLKKHAFIFLPFTVGVVLIFVQISLTGRLPFTTHAQTPGTVTFGVAGDTGGGSEAGAVMNAVKSANMDFFVHVGDMRYSSQGSPAGWASWVKSIVGSVYPFEIVTGNHDDQDISAYVAGLPDHMNSQGIYGQNYYFDYPQTSPLVRIILISPGLFNPDIAWLTTAIDSARSAGTPWVVVGMHYNCITTGAKSCSAGASLDALLYSKKVDLILQGHDHNYQRSKQLSCAKTNTTDQSCIVNAGPNYTKGAGSVLVISGNGGNGLYGVNSGDSEAGYFAKINSDTYGFTKFTITANQIAEQFVRTGGGSLNDSFTIAGGTSVPSQTPSSAPTQANPTSPYVSPTYSCFSNLPCTSPLPSQGPTSASPSAAAGPTSASPSAAAGPTTAAPTSIPPAGSALPPPGLANQLIPLIIGLLIAILTLILNILKNKGFLTRLLKILKIK